MDERPPAAAVANQRHAAVAKLIDHGVREHAGIRPVKRSVTQHDAFGRCRRGDGLLEILNCLERAAQLPRRIRIQRIRLGPDRTAGAIGPATETLGDEAFCAGLARG